MPHAVRIVTTSWDDGDPSDLRIAGLLRSRGLSGTFYVPIFGCKGPRPLGRTELRSLSSDRLEIGAHGLSHTSLPELSSRELAHELATCKRMLEDIVSEEVRVFCYPRGRYNAEAIRLLKATGYQGARTTRMLGLKLSFCPFEMSTSVQAYPHSRLDYIKNLLRARNLSGLRDYLRHFAQVDNWVELGKRLFDVVLQEGGIWHLYGHSWEIEKLDLWEDLQTMLDYVCGRPEVTYLSNGEVLELLREHSPAIRTGKGSCEVSLRP